MAAPPEATTYKEQHSDPALRCRSVVITEIGIVALRSRLQARCSHKSPTAQPDFPKTYALTFANMEQLYRNDTHILSTWAYTFSYRTIVESLKITFSGT